MVYKVQTGKRTLYFTRYTSQKRCSLIDSPYISRIEGQVSTVHENTTGIVMVGDIEIADALETAHTLTMV